MFRCKNIIYFILYILLISCSSDHKSDTRDIIVEIKGQTLHKQEIDSLFVKSISYSDSVEIAENYINNWIKDRLILEKALENIKEKDVIEKEVQRFREELIISSYISSLVTEEFVEKNIEENECELFYSQNKEHFILDKQMIKGIFLKIPADAPGLKDIKKKIKVVNEESLDIIDKYSLQNAITYEYFMDKWISSDLIFKSFPSDMTQGNKLASNITIDATKDDYWYYLFIKDVLNKGEIEPFDISKSKIEDILLQKKMKEYIFTLKNDLYIQAKEKNDIKFFENRNMNQQTEE